MIFLSGLIIVNAQERIQSIPLNHTSESQNMNINIYTSSGGNFANWGRGYLTFSVAQYKAGAGINFTMSTIKGIRVTSSGNIYTCQFGTTSNNFDYDDNLKLVVYSVICDITMGNQGLQSIDIEMSNSLTNSIVTKTSEYMTFSDNLQIDTTQAINNVTSTMQNYLQTIINNQTTYTQSINETITNVVNTNFSTLQVALIGKLNSIQQVIEALGRTQQQIQQKVNEIESEDIDSTSKEKVDETDYNDYKDKEDELMNIASEADLTNLEIGINRQTSSTIWQLITRIIQTNAKIFSLFISILSIGIIKIALAR